MIPEEFQHSSRLVLVTGDSPEECGESVSVTEGRRRRQVADNGSAEQSQHCGYLEMYT